MPMVPAKMPVRPLKHSGAKDPERGTGRGRLELLQTLKSGSQTVFLRDLLEHEVLLRVGSKLAFPLGLARGRRPVVADLASMSHVLVVGMNGAERLGAIKAMLVSLFVRTTPEELRLILVDPRTDLAAFQGAPHLMLPVLSDWRHGVWALQWAVEEMTRRYRVLADAGARNINVYHRLVETAASCPMPYVVIIITELGHLMNAAREATSACVARLAQMARGAGICLTAATGFPTTRVVSGIIKANFGARIAFKLPTASASKNVLGGVGAEALRGKGDLLFLSPISSQPERVRGVCVSDEEIQRIVEHLNGKAGRRPGT